MSTRHRVRFNRCRLLKSAAAVAAAPYVITSTALGNANTPPASEVQHQAGRQVSLLVQGKPLWTCHLAADGGQPYFHPLALSDGTDLSILNAAMLFHAPFQLPAGKSFFYGRDYFVLRSGRTKMVVPIDEVGCDSNNRAF